MASLKIDLYGDVVCPWCFIGQHRLNKVVEERFSGIAVDIEHHPVILLPVCPAEGLRITELLKSRHGVKDASAAWVRPHAEARASGLNLDLARQPFAFPTLDAHTLIRCARLLGSQHALAYAISKSYFVDALNISDAQVLSNIGAEHGFAHDEVISLLSDQDEQAETRQKAASSAVSGVRSVPHYVFNGQLAMNGGRSEKELASAIEAVLSYG